MQVYFRGPTRRGGEVPSDTISFLKEVGRKGFPSEHHLHSHKTHLPPQIFPGFLSPCVLVLS